jgi:hypothetical protein
MTSLANNILNRRALGDIGNKLVVSNNANTQFGVINKRVPLATTTTTSKHVAVVEQQEAPLKQQQQPVVNETPKEIIVLDSNDVSLNSTSASVEEDISDIVDIDEGDYENTQLAADYVKDIYNYLYHMEKQFRVSSSFLDGKIVTSKMRSVLIDWLIQVHLKFHLLQETLYLCVQIIDAYLEAQDVPKMQLQLVGVTALFLAAKYEEMYVPAIEDFVYMTDNTYTKSEIRQMEISILKTLGFMFGKPLPLHFLRRFSKAGQADPKQHTLAKYFMELSLHDASFSHMDPSYLAACSLYLAFQLLDGPEWNKTLEYYTRYKKASLLLGVDKIKSLVKLASNADYKYRAAANKYASAKFLRVSLFPELKFD